MGDSLDPDALFRRFGELVRRYVASKVPAHAVDDVCGEIWLAVSKNAGSFRGDSSQPTWLIQITRHKIADWYRRAKGKEHPHETFNSAACLRDSHIPGLTTPGRKLERQEDLAELARRMSALEAIDQEMVVLRYGWGFKPAEIVDVLGTQLSPNAVAQRIHRALGKLREHGPL